MLEQVRENIMTPRPTQVSGALFLEANRYACLADEPRVGKTGAALIAADGVLAENVLIITTASGRSVWARAVPQWTWLPRTVSVVKDRTNDTSAQTVIVGWPAVTNGYIKGALLARKWDLLILDESHYAKNPEAARTKAVFGLLQQGGKRVDTLSALVAKADRVWALTGTPMPNSPADLYPMLRALRPECLEAKGDWPCVLGFESFMYRYCQVKMKQISKFRRVPVVVGGKNLDELRARISGFMLRRTQKDVGIQSPVYDLFPLSINANDKLHFKGLNEQAILNAALSGETSKLEMHLGPLRRVTGVLKAQKVVEALKEEFECGLDKIVLAYWHRQVGDVLEQGLSEHGLYRLDGSTHPKMRQQAEEEFRHNPEARVFLAQIQAAGEAIDLSASAELMFVESSFVPKDMKQMSLRITNHTQQRQPVVRVAVLEGSIDEALETILLRKWSAIRQVMKEK